MTHTKYKNANANAFLLLVLPLMQGPESELIMQTLKKGNHHLQQRGLIERNPPRYS